MQKQEKVVAFVGRSWAVHLGVGLAWGMAIWTVMFLASRGVVAFSLGPVMGILFVAGAVIFTLWYLASRSRLEIDAEGLRLSGPLGSRVIPWSDLTVVEPSWAWQWVRCRDAAGRATVRLTSSRLYPRLQHQIQRDNQELATRLWYAGPASRGG
ncbi:PH domain-containing protein [Nocardioides sp. NPDC006303]|uniref:PH domain-containing protein n=1 Tax=Nocardioides sp. NPDC006303 TaxID=3156747 RepID=UPI0033BD7DD5